MNLESKSVHSLLHYESDAYNACSYVLICLLTWSSTLESHKHSRDRYKEKLGERQREKRECWDICILQMYIFCSNLPALFALRIMWVIKSTLIKHYWAAERIRKQIRGKWKGEKQCVKMKKNSKRTGWSCLWFYTQYSVYVCVFVFITHLCVCMWLPFAVVE